jgi:hypothetical protein
VDGGAADAGAIELLGEAVRAVLGRVKTSVRPTSPVSPGSRRRRSSIARLSALSTKTTDCSTPSAVVTVGVIETRAGLASIVRARVSMGPAMVAEKKSV